jgi:hypothetical protein
MKRICSLPHSPRGDSELNQMLCHALVNYCTKTRLVIIYIITLFPFVIEMLQYDWLCSGHMMMKEMFYIPIKLKPELARASMTTSDVKNQWRSNFQQHII